MATSDLEKMGPTRTSTNNKAPSEGGKTEAIIDNKADVALQYLAEHGRVEYTPEEERTVRWRIDLFLLPVLSITFGLQYLDKVTLSYAAVYNMREDVGLVGQQYSWANSIFYFGYLVGQPPANYLLQKFPIGKFVSLNLFLWGAMVMLCAVCTNFAGLATVRFLMGLFEACVQPAWVHITSIYWTGHEQGSRVAAWWSLVGVSQILGGLLSYGIGHVEGTAVKQWQLIFLICGGFTVAWAFVVYFTVPDSPAKAAFLNERQRIIAIERLRANRTGMKNQQFKPAQALEALRDPQVWMISMWVFLSNVPNIAGSFLPLIIKDLGFTGLTTTLLTMPSGAVELVAMIIAGALTLTVQNYRSVIMFAITLPTFAGCIILTVTPQSAKWTRATACWLLLCGPAAYTILLSMISSNIAGYSKKVTTTTIVFIMYCAGNIVSPQVFLAKDAPGYKTGLHAILACWSLTLLLSVSLGLYYRFENKKRDRLLSSLSQAEVDAMTVPDEEYLDRTDKEDYLKFRYRW